MELEGQMWSAELNLLAAIRDSAAKYSWHGWTHSTDAGIRRRPNGHSTSTIAVQAIVKVSTTILEICLKCRYHQPWNKKDSGPEEATAHWYELLIRDKYCVFGRKILVEIHSYPGDATFPAHKSAFEAARDLAKFCTDQTRFGKEELVQKVADLLNLKALQEIKKANQSIK